MRALTGVLKYVGIVLLASVLIIAFTIGVMFFVPSVNIFGFYFRQTISSNTTIYKSGALKTIDDTVNFVSTVTLNIDAGDYHVAIIPRESPEIEIKVNNNSIGLVKATAVNKENKNLFADEYLGMRDSKGQLIHVEHDKNGDDAIGEDEKDITITPEIAKAKDFIPNPNYVEDVNVGQNICVVNPYIVVKDLEKQDKAIYTYEIKEPQGLLSRNSSNVIAFYVPVTLTKNVKVEEDKEEKKTFNVRYNINIKTNNGDVRLRNSTVEDTDNFKDFLYIDELSIETNKGSGSLKGVKTDGSDANKDSGAVTTLILPSLNIKTNGGTFDFSNYKLVRVNGAVNLESEKAKYKFNVLESYYKEGADDKYYQGSINISGTNVEFEATKIFCGMDGFSYKSDTGMLKIDKLYTGNIRNGATEESYEYEPSENGAFTATTQTAYFVDVLTPYENTIFTESAVVELGTVIGKLGLQNEMGAVKIGHLSHQATIRTENSNITIETSGFLLDNRKPISKKGWYTNVVPEGDVKTECFYDEVNDKVFTDTSSLILYSTYGDISVGEYYQDAVMHSKKGQITAYSKYSGIKNGDKELPLKKGSTAVAYYGEGTVKDDQGNDKSKTTWWRNKDYTDEITQSYILNQLEHGRSVDEQNNGATYYSDPNYVAPAYYGTGKAQGADGNKVDKLTWWRNKSADGVLTGEITESYILNQLDSNHWYYFTTADESQARYYYTDATTKDGNVTITTDKNPVRIVASDRAAINLLVKGVLLTNDLMAIKDISAADYMANLNPFGTDGYMYIAETKNGSVNVELPITSYIVQVNCKNVEGSIGATSNVGEYDKETKTRPEVQINSEKPYQPKIRLTGKKAILSSDV